MGVVIKGAQQGGKIGVKPPVRRPYTEYDNLPFMLNVNEIAAVCRISRAKAYSLVKQEDFPATVVGKRVLVEKTDLLQWLRQNKRNTNCSTKRGD